MTESEFMKRIGNNIRDELDYLEMTQRELSKITGINQSILSRYIKGEVMPSLKNIINITCALDCRIGEIIPMPNDLIK